MYACNTCTYSLKTKRLITLQFLSTKNDLFQQMFCEIKEKENIVYFSVFV